MNAVFIILYSVWYFTVRFSSRQTQATVYIQLRELHGTPATKIMNAKVADIFVGISPI